jgi:branched-subunit amino acid aminotransferase/4-amino-4-deoxychorismate lyase
MFFRVWPRSIMGGGAARPLREEQVMAASGTVYVGGRFVPGDQAAVSVFDHGVLYGDGVFEGIRAYNGRVFKLSRHIERLFDSAHAIRLDIPLSPAEMIAWCSRRAA